jgi:hypothetical protein
MTLPNLTNHPVASWSPTQLAAARALGLGEPADFPGGLPLVPPDADTDAVCRMADELCLRLELLHIRGACLQGEYTLTVALLHRLQAQGIRCFSATTERRVEDALQPDGSVVKKSVFAFVRWREYPALEDDLKRRRIERTIEAAGTLDFELEARQIRDLGSLRDEQA